MCEKAHVDDYNHKYLQGNVYNIRKNSNSTKWYRSAVFSQDQLEPNFKNRISQSK